MRIEKEDRQEARGKSRWNVSQNFAKLSFFFAFCFSISANAQCAMCRAVLETEEGGVKAEAVNDGIIYLMVFPYLLVGILGYVIYRMKTKKKPGN
ncbi:MAG TPA: hypothetical protein VFR70_02180 [Flavobacterium sp.]|nr:hypothetical protein [Flavobacterium sp.]